MSGTTTFTVDSSAATGALYQYRLRTTWATGAQLYSNVFLHRVVAAGTLTRTSTGLLFHDNFDRANGAPGTNWAIESGNWAINNNALQVSTITWTNSMIRLAAIADRKDVHVQFRTSRSQLFSYATIYTRRSGSNWYQGDLGSLNEGNRPRDFRQTGTSHLPIGYGTLTSQVDSLYRLTYSVIGTQHRLWANNRLEISATDATAANDVAGNLALGAHGGGANGIARFDDFVVCSSRTVTVTGLPAGLRIRVGGRSSAPAAAGTPLTLDLIWATLPAAHIEVLDPYSVVISSLSPTNGICGGDSFTYS